MAGNMIPPIPPLPSDLQLARLITTASRALWISAERNLFLFPCFFLFLYVFCPFFPHLFLSSPFAKRLAADEIDHYSIPRSMNIVGRPFFYSPHIFSTPYFFHPFLFPPPSTSILLPTRLISLAYWVATISRLL